MPKLIYIRFYKPYCVLSQFTSGPEHRNLSEFGFPKNVYTVGRLDYVSEGLLLLTNDGRFKNRLINPAFGHPKTYWVQVENIPSAESLAKLNSGITLKDFHAKPCKSSLLPVDPRVPARTPPIRYRKDIPTAWLEMTLSEGKNRQVRRMTAAIGHPTLRLIRVSIERWTWEGLYPGDWDFIKADDINRFLILK